jgi:tripartite-type tricarboxylate transporter receptor subunit TctC
MKSICRLCATIAARFWQPIRWQRSDYPARPITIVVPYTPGGSTDITARLTGQKLEERLGKPVLIENRPGAGTAIASTAVKSTPDGYTLLLATPTPMAINVTLHKNLQYDPAADFIPLVLIARAPFVLIVNPSLPVNSVQELIKYAKDKSGQLSYGSGGPGSPHHLYAELLKDMTGVQITHVPYKGTVQALNDVIAGHIQMMFSDIPPAIGVAGRQGSRAWRLDQSSPRRISQRADDRRSGVPDFKSRDGSCSSPRENAGADRREIARRIEKIVATPEIRNRLPKFATDRHAVDRRNAVVREIGDRALGQGRAAGRHRAFGIARSVSLRSVLG